MTAENTGTEAAPADPQGEPLRVAIALTSTDMFFGTPNTTAADLYARDTAHFSRFRDTTKFFAQEIEHPFTDVDATLLRFAHTKTGSLERGRIFAEPIARFGADIIFVQNDIKTALRLGQMCPCPTVLVLHNYPHEIHRPLKKWSRRFAYRRLGGVAFVSEAIRDVFQAAYPSLAVPLGVVHNGLDTKAWTPDRPKEKRILYVSRPVPQKGMVEGMEALEHTLDAHPDWSAHIVISRHHTKARDADYADRVHAVLARLEGRIAITNIAPYDLIQELCETSAITLVSAAEPEGFGRVALEAMAGGSAVVSTRQGGLQDVLGPEEVKAALSIETADSEALFRAMDRLIRDPDLRKTLVRNGHERAQTHFDLRSTAQAFDHFAQRVVAHHASRRGRPTKRPSPAPAPGSAL